ESPLVERVLDTAAKIEGLARHCSQHAAGVVITPMPITDLVPVRRIGDGQIITQYSMEPIEKLGLVKMDFLGLRTLSVIEEALQNIKKAGKPVPDMEKIPLDDAGAYDLLQKADTLGIFQLESSGMRALLKKLKVDCFEDIIAALAMYRPGPLGSGMVDQYVQCKHGRSEVEYLHPLLEEVLRETYGVVLYQEQVMQCAALLAGYSLGEADILRRAMGKKKADEMEQQRNKFVEGARERGIAEKKAQSIFDIILEFAGYGFNKSHSAAYAMITYHTAWLKANYRPEFMAAYLSSQIGSKKEDLASYVRDVRNSGINVLPPDVNTSHASFTPVEGVIRFGLGAVAKCGQAAVDAILSARQEGGSYESLWDFLCRVDLRVVNKSVVENLIKAGAFDGLNENRRQHAEALPELIAMASRKCMDDSQQALFDLTEDVCGGDGPSLPEVEDYELRERLDGEKESTGLYISGHPFEQYEARVRSHSNCSIADLRRWKGRKTPLLLGGMILSVRERTTRNGDTMGTIELEDGEARVEAVCFPKTWAGLRGRLAPGQLCFVSGFPEERSEASMIARTVSPLEEDGPPPAEPYLRFSVHAGPMKNISVKELFRALKAFPGKSPVIFEIKDGGDSVTMLLQDLKVNPAAPISDAVEEILPVDAFSIG
ncbi:MAG: DNA polymerase III subunit alpha, partial [Aminivibrio sp.]